MAIYMFGLLTSVSFVMAGGAAPPGPVFFLCKANIVAAKLAEAPDSQFEAVVRLTPAATHELSEFTANHIGETAEIRLGRDAVAHIPIHAHIQSGILAIGRTPTREQAEALVKRLTSLPPGEACGPAA